MHFTDILYTKGNGVATITLNRPEVLNAFRGLTVAEMIAAVDDAWTDDDVGVVVLTGAGERSFCVGGDQKERTPRGYGGRDRDPNRLHYLIQNIPKPVIAAVNGYAIGGGHVLHLVCDLSVAVDTAIFGQVGPKVGSVDPGWGTAYLARVVGQKRAREIWYLCKQYTAQEALAMGLVNRVVPREQFWPTVQELCVQLLDKSPTALKLAKASFSADLEHISGIAHLGFAALKLFYQTEESGEGRNAFVEKRPVNFRRFRGRSEARD